VGLVLSGRSGESEFDLQVIAERGSCIEDFDADQPVIPVEIGVDAGRDGLGTCRFASCYREPDVEEVSGGVVFDLSSRYALAA